jgi:hypothetical protein
MVEADFDEEFFPDAAKATGHGLSSSKTSKLVRGERQNLNKSNSFNTLSTAEESIGSFRDSTSSSSQRSDIKLEPSKSHSHQPKKRSSIKMKATAQVCGGKSSMERRDKPFDHLDSNDSCDEFSFEDDDWWQQQTTILRQIIEGKALMICTNIITVLIILQIADLCQRLLRGGKVLMISSLFKSFFMERR